MPTTPSWFHLFGAIFHHLLLVFITADSSIVFFEQSLETMLVSSSLPHLANYSAGLRVATCSSASLVLWLCRPAPDQTTWAHRKSASSYHSVSSQNISCCFTQSVIIWSSLEKGWTRISDSNYWGLSRCVSCGLMVQLSRLVVLDA